ncbi:MAG: hypothetical protein GY771_02430 [bacterium]|nr:hypothetical protein [bacterium]
MTYWGLAAAIFAVGAVAIFWQINDPLVTDEPQFVDVAASIASSGKPMGYSGTEWNPVLTHPTLYHSLLAIPVGIFGKTPAAGRSVGIICYFITGLLVFLTVTRISTGKWSPHVALGLYMLHPLAVNGALLVDIDNSLLVMAASLFLYLLARINFQLDLKRSLLFGLLFGVFLLSKLTTPPLLLVALALYYLLVRDFRKIGYVALIGVVGAAVFAAVYFPYALLMDLPWQQPFTHSVSRALEAGGGVPLYIVLAKRLIRLVLWTMPPTLIVASLAFWVRRKEWLAGRLTPGDFALLTGVVIFVFYLFVGGEAYGFPKYDVPVIPLFAVAVGAQFGYKLGKEKPFSIAFVLGLALLYYVLAVRDPLYYPYMFGELMLRGVAKSVLLKTIALNVGLSLIPLVLFPFVSRRGGRPMIYVLLALTAGPSLIGNQVYRDYSHRYNYGEEGLEQVIETVHALPEDAVVVVPIDVAFGEGYEHEHYATADLLSDRDGLVAVTRRDDTRCIVFRDSYYLNEPWKLTFDDPGLNAELDNYYNEVRMGSFVIYLRVRGHTGGEEA